MNIGKHTAIFSRMCGFTFEYFYVIAQQDVCALMCELGAYGKVDEKCCNSISSGSVIYLPNCLTTDAFKALDVTIKFIYTLLNTYKKLMSVIDSHIII